MNQTLAKAENQYLVKRSVTWKQFKTSQSAFVEVKTSVWLPDLDIAHLEECLLMDSQLNAMTAFEQKYTNEFTP